MENSHRRGSALPRSSNEAGVDEVPGAAARQRRRRREADHTAETVGGAIAVPAARLAVVPAVFARDRPLAFHPEPHDAGRAAQPVEFQVGRAAHEGRIDRGVGHQLEVALGREIASALRRPDRRAGEDPGAANPERMDEGPGEPAPVHRLEPIGDRDGERAVRRQRLSRAEPDGDRVPPLDAAGDRRLDAEELARIDRAVERARDRAVEGDGDGGRRSGVFGRDHPKDAQLRHRVRDQEKSRGGQQSQRRQL